MTKKPKRERILERKEKCIEEKRDKGERNVTIRKKRENFQSYQLLKEKQRQGHLKNKYR